MNHVESERNSQKGKNTGGGLKAFKAGPIGRKKREELKKDRGDKDI